MSIPRVSNVLCCAGLKLYFRPYPSEADGPLVGRLSLPSLPEVDSDPNISIKRKITIAAKHPSNTFVQFALL